MKLKTKKKIAKEFLILLSMILLSILFYIITVGYNYLKESEIERIENTIKSNKKEKYDLEKTILEKTNEHDEYTKKLSKFYGENFDSDVILESLSRLKKTDSIKYKWNYDWSDSLIEFHKSIGYHTPERLEEYINYTTSINSDNNRIDSIVENISKQVNHILELKEEKISNTKQLNYTFLFFATIFIFRVLIQSIIWSVKTLRQN